MKEISFINDDIERFSMRRKEDFSINLNVEPFDVDKDIKIYHYPITIKIDNEYRYFTVGLSDIDFTFIRNKKLVLIEIPHKENQMFFVAIRQMVKSIENIYQKEIKDNYYKRKGKFAILTLRVMKETSIISLSGKRIDPYGGMFSSLNNKKGNSRSIRIQFFIFYNGNKSFYNIRLLNMELNTVLENELIDDKTIISFNDFKNLTKDERILYYGTSLNRYDENINNKTYGWIGLYLENAEIYACNKNDISELINVNIKFKPNTYLLPHKESLIEPNTHYKDRQNYYHYFCVLMFDRQRHDSNSTMDNKINLYNVVKNYLSTRLIDVLGLWYDQSTPPSSHIHFNIHIRSKLILNYLYILFDDWKRYHGKPFLSHMFDPIMGRLYLCRNNKMFVNDNKIKYTTSKEIFNRAKENFKLYIEDCQTFNNSSSFIDFLNISFDNNYTDLEQYINQYKQSLLTLNIPINLPSDLVYNIPSKTINNHNNLTTSIVSLISSIKNYSLKQRQHKNYIKEKTTFIKQNDDDNNIDDKIKDLMKEKGIDKKTLMLLLNSLPKN
jgi:hypothetical protein